jgi:hypothetical protein
MQGGGRCAGLNIELSTSNIEHRTGITSKFNVQRWMFDVQPAAGAALPICALELSKSKTPPVSRRRLQIEPEPAN